ncbi:MAG: LacI family DNA-binding transcriptional regulator [Clostridia bacterium]|nr:LacI family DNA-binding transcriptional regulator [Clostridia bacterium]
MKKKVTMSDIGAALGVSTVTVSKALGGREGVGDEMRDRIRRTAREMGYGAVRTQSPAGDRADAAVVGILTCERFFDKASFYASMYRELTGAILEEGMLGALEIVTGGMEKALALPALVKDGRVDSLVMLGQFGPEYMDLVSSSGLRTVCLDFYGGRGGCAVVSDGRGGAWQITRHLIGLGHRKIAFVGSLAATSSITDRMCGYLRAMTEAGLLPVPPEWILEDRDADGRYCFPLRLPRDLPTAFVCNNDDVAAQLIRQLNDMGIAVPGDVSVTGFDDYTLFPSPVKLTTFRPDRERMARAAVRALKEIPGTEEQSMLRVEVGGWMIPGGSAGPAKRK